MAQPMDKTQRDRWRKNPGLYPKMRDYLTTLENNIDAFTTTTTTTTTTTSSSSTTTSSSTTSSSSTTTTTTTAP